MIKVNPKKNESFATQVSSCKNICTIKKKQMQTILH